MNTERKARKKERKKERKKYGDVKLNVDKHNCEKRK